MLTVETVFGDEPVAVLGYLEQVIGTLPPAMFVRGRQLSEQLVPDSAVVRVEIAVEQRPRLRHGAARSAKAASSRNADGFRRRGWGLRRTGQSLRPLEGLDDGLPEVRRAQDLEPVVAIRLRGLGEAVGIGGAGAVQYTTP
jgi:hypothetical protein